MTTYRLSAIRSKARLSLLNSLRATSTPYIIRWDKGNKEYLILTPDEPGYTK